MSTEDLLYHTGNLTRSIQAKTDYCTVAISLIIPRYVDHETSEPLIDLYNEQVKAHKKTWNVSIIPTHSIFLRNGKPIRELYQRSDGLHPSEIGDERLRSHLSNYIAIMRDGRRWNRTKRSPHPTIIRRNKNLY